MISDNIFELKGDYGRIGSYRGFNDANHLFVNYKKIIDLIEIDIKNNYKEEYDKVKELIDLNLLKYKNDNYLSIGELLLG